MSLLREQLKISGECLARKLGNSKCHANARHARNQLNLLAFMGTQRSSRMPRGSYFLPYRDHF